MSILMTQGWYAEIAINSDRQTWRVHVIFPDMEPFGRLELCSMKDAFLCVSKAYEIWKRKA
jgi:hypothetical protein